MKLSDPTIEPLVPARRRRDGIDIFARAPAASG